MQLERDGGDKMTGLRKQSPCPMRQWYYLSWNGALHMGVL
jgi:hypothetical protein